MACSEPFNVIAIVYTDYTTTTELNRLLDLSSLFYKSGIYTLYRCKALLNVGTIKQFPPYWVCDNLPLMPCAGPQYILHHLYSAICRLIVLLM